MRTYSLLNSVALMRGQKAYPRSSDIRIKLDLARVLRAKCTLVTLLQIIDRWDMLRCRHLEFRQSLGSLGDQDMQHLMQNTDRVGVIAGYIPTARSSRGPEVCFKVARMVAGSQALVEKPRLGTCICTRLIMYRVAGYLPQPLQPMSIPGYMYTDVIVQKQTTTSIQ